MNGAQGEETVVTYPDGNVTMGMVRFTTNGPVITLEDGCQVHNEEGYWYRVKNQVLLQPTGKTAAIPLDKELTLKLRPSVCTVKKYAGGMAQTQHQIYPSATHGWYGRMVSGSMDAFYCIQEIEGSKNSWLTIFDPERDSIHESHEIRPYEIDAIRMVDDLTEYMKYMSKPPFDIKKVRAELLSVLDEPPPAWDDLSDLVEGVRGIIPRMGKDMRHTLDNLVPTGIEQSVREEILAFLAWVVKDDVPLEDPVDLDEKLYATPYTRGLLSAHIIRRIKGFPSKQYVKIINREYQDARQDDLESNPKLRRIISNLAIALDREPIDISVIKTVEELNETGAIVSSLPITREMASQNPEAWKKRMLMVHGGIKLEFVPYLSAIGLDEVVYIGGAHQWPHRHLSYSGLLDDTQPAPLRLTSMIMPPEATERVLRIREKAMKVDWFARIDNLQLFSNEKKSWKIPLGRIAQAFRGERLLSQLHEEFGYPPDKFRRTLTKDEAVVTDFSSLLGLYLPLLESQRIPNYLGIDIDRFLNIIRGMVNSGLAKAYYSIPNRPFSSLVVTLNGPEEVILSSVRGLLRYTPFASARVVDSNLRAIVITRQPEYLTSGLIDTISRAAKEVNLEIGISRVSNYRVYRHNLFQRLLEPDNSWNSDINALLSQISSL
ncbi:MAG: hypothetical protein RTU30_08455 [Candidatus Thorarchaeota archaeon]